MLKLVKLQEKYKTQLFEMMDEWYQTGEKIVPYAIRKNDYHNFEEYLEKLEVKENEQGLVPDSTFFCLDTEKNIFVGAVNIRHYLNESLLLNGGHVGDGVRPSERRKGIATKMIGLALEECRKLGIKKVLMVCNKENIGSAKSIQNNGGILDNAYSSISLSYMGRVQLYDDPTDEKVYTFFEISMVGFAILLGFIGRPCIL